MNDNHNPVTHLRPLRLFASSRNRTRGFTLIEILVALTILAIAMAALIKTTVGNAANASHLKNKTLAHWVAMNKATELRLSKEWSATGTKKGRTTMGQAEWRWKVKIKNTDDKDIRRLTITVRSEDQDSDDPMVTVIAFSGRPM